MNLILSFIIIDNIEKNSTAETDQSAFTDGLYWNLPGFFCYQSQLSKIITFFIILIESIFLWIFGYKETLNNYVEFSTHITFVNDIFIGLESYLC